MAKKKKTLPANFKELLEAKDLDALKAVFNECELNAYDRYSFKTPALSFYKIPLNGLAHHSRRRHQCER